MKNVYLPEYDTSLILREAEKLFSNTALGFRFGNGSSLASVVFFQGATCLAPRASSGFERSWIPGLAPVQGKNQFIPFPNQVQHSGHTSSTREFQGQHKEVQFRHENFQFQREGFSRLLTFKFNKALPNSTIPEQAQVKVKFNTKEHSK